MSLFAIQAIGTAISVVSAIRQGQQARDAARFEQQQQLFASKQTKVEAAATAAQRIRQFDSDQASNRAFAAFMGRDPNDRSLRAFNERQREIAYSDAEMAESTGLIRASQQRKLAEAAGIRARNAIIGSYLNAGSAIASGLWRYEIYKTDKTQLTGIG